MNQHWLVQLGDISSTIMGQAPPGASCNKDGNGTAFVKAGEFGEREPVIQEWTTKPLKMAQRGDVLVCVVGATAGKINLAIDSAIGRSVAAVRPDAGKLDTNYLHHFLATKVAELRARSQGLAQGVITREMLAGLTLQLPSLDEQRRIAAILDKADALRQKRKRAIALLDSLTQSIFLEMFGDAGDQQRWVRGALDGLASIDAPMVDPRKPEFADLLHYGPDRIEKGTGRLMPALSARQDGLTSGKFLCNRDHILYSKIRPYLNKVALCEVDCLCSADVYPVTAGDQMDRVFLWFILRSPDFLRYAESCSNRANIPKLNRDQFFGYSTIIPPIELQRAFAERIRGVQSIETCANYHLSKANEAFASLQHRAFSGQL